MCYIQNLHPLLESLDGLRRSGMGWVALCPSHEDRQPSLSITPREGKLWLNCFAGCEYGNILADLALRGEDLNYEEESPRPEKEVARYPYRDENGVLLYTVIRYHPKTFRCQRPDGSALNGARRVLFRLPELLAADPSRWVLFVEGEKDAERLAKEGFVATTSGGASSWRDEYASYFTGRRVAIIPDNDEPGRAFAAKVSTGILQGNGKPVTVTLPGAKDASEYLDNGGTAGGLKDLIIRASTRAEQDGPVPASSLKTEEIEWLWGRRIPFGKLTILEGDPGLGKSTLCTEIASRLSTGSSLPFGQPLKRAASLILTAEDGPSDTLHPRLLAAGADLERVFVDQSVPSISTDLAKIASWIEKRDVRLLVIDPLMAFLGTKMDAYRDQDMRSVLAPLSQMAAQMGTAILLVRHLTKPGPQQVADIYRGGGSIGIGAAARSVLLLTKGKDDPSMRILSSVKCNLSRPPERLYFRLTGEEPYSRLEWTDPEAPPAPPSENSAVEL